jgi:outer membrane protein OmpA-like peptidoglycan-associated protein
MAGVAGMLMVAGACAQTDLEGSKDAPGLHRMPGYYISQFTETQFDSNEFLVVDKGGEKKETVEGHKWYMRYDRSSTAPPASALQVIRNYQNAARSQGGQILSENGSDGDRETTFRIVTGNQELWANLHVVADGAVYVITAIQKQAMEQQVTIDAAAMASSLADTGRVAIYGIYFDTGKADIKPESEPAIDEIAKLLTNQPALKVYIVGHTDMVGDAASNVRLSQARAQSVINALVSRQHIAASRLIAFGNGPYAPVAPNKTDEGRAKNRRVELVEIATR